MNDFKEWLSDYLRYFVLGFAVLLALGAIVLGVRLYQSIQTVQGDPDDIIILDVTEKETVSETETESETVTERETETEKISETEKETEKETKKETEIEMVKASQNTAGQTEEMERKTPETAQSTAGKKDNVQTVNSSGTSQRETGTQETAAPETKTPETKTPETKTPETKTPETKAPETDPPETDPPEPVYLTMTGACYIRSYADYGDNIIGEYPAGTVVEFLEDVGGWYKVQIDGMVGYMGAKFFQ